jgi:hypothetical protein
MSLTPVAPGPTPPCARRRCARRFGWLRALVALLAFAAPAHAAGAPCPDPCDSMPALVRRMDRWLQAHEADGVTMDWRYSVSPSEEIRQTVVCQTLGYAELQRLAPSPRLRQDVLDHAGYMLERLGEIRSYTPFDGMLGYALFEAYEVTHEPRFLSGALSVTNQLMTIPTEQCVLNGGLMLAMATAKLAQLTGSPAAAQKSSAIVAQLVPYQNADGSFPHWCVGSRDIHYTGWMCMEMIHLGWLMPGDTLLAPMLARATTFLEGRVAPDGSSVYEESCGVGCTNYYYSRASGCPYDYDSRGWTVEPEYLALAFDHGGSTKYADALSFLLSIEKDGVFADQYGWWPPPDDPEYPWTIEDSSAVCSSIIFWALATEATDRVRRGVPLHLVLDDTAALPPEAPADRALVVTPNPARGGCTLRFALAAGGNVTITLHDVAGRRLRTLRSGWFPAGPTALRWDGTDAAGSPLPAGVYLARLAAPGHTDGCRVVLVR